MQEAREALDVFAYALLHIANCAYLYQPKQLQMKLVRDRFIAGLHGDHL